MSCELSEFMSSSRSLCTICVGSKVTRNLYVSREAQSPPHTVFWFVCGALVPLCKQCRCTAVWQLVLPIYAIHIFTCVVVLMWLALGNLCNPSQLTKPFQVANTWSFWLLPQTLWLETQVIYSKSKTPLHGDFDKSGGQNRRFGPHQTSSGGCVRTSRGLHRKSNRNQRSQRNQNREGVEYFRVLAE